MIREVGVSKSELEKLAYRHPLRVGCNRRSLFEAFENQWESTKHDGMDLVYIMADIDHVKFYHDRFVHAVGTPH